MDYLTSAQNPRVKAWAALKERKYREQSGTYLVEGVRSITTYLQHGAEILSFLYDPGASVSACEELARQCEQQGVPVFALTSQLMAQIADTVHPQGAMAVVQMDKSEIRAMFQLTRAAGDCRDVLLLVDGVRDPGNLGTMIRSAAAVGVRGVIALEGTVDFYNPKVVRATMGALATVAVAEATAEQVIRYAKEYEVRLIGADAHAQTSFFEVDLQDRIGLVIGGEAQGISEKLYSSLAARVALPMPGATESLNAGVASSVLLYEALRQRLG
ncbi:TrmH family RNA methyltransferase [Sulfoacidibacillus thermotolerans]|uniref:RNA 2-O ribose methyltransferase substrate binding domain-containing protein n=1 Tax=Sulfoacidibacillus thermotolerans TaxID=1765684 RepID=A0A2U3DB50_SULT2|nr:RNA methyltransferase [Sulfoacidibacillus thermotolerans]PWI58503.1 hypothetical protein BM613_02985 [Sulfoacidibacillus thermotolerans]